MDPALREFLIAWVIGWNAATLLIILYGVFLFGIPQKIIGFFVYYVYARFFPNKLDEFVFYGDGTWCKRIDKAATDLYSERLRVIRDNLAKLQQGSDQHPDASNNSRAADNIAVP